MIAVRGLKQDPKAKKAMARWIHARLAKEYGEQAPPEPRTDPLDELCLTLLSQNTNDLNRDRAYAELRRRFPTWAEVAAAPVKKVEDAIRAGGLAHQKSARLQAMLREIARREGRLDLSRICRMTRDEALDYLYSFKGVGRKTAAIVLLFSCGVPVFPVDTHIHRVSRRLGIVPMKADADQAHDVLDLMVPDKMKYGLHINMIAHGRKVCHPRKPECAACCLRKKCPSAFRIR
ncbi:MAG TPA: endonuclease III [bacterium]|nr:endonuclease III [bacterium]